ncbi:MAG: hypothetical protein JWR38_2501 [Mucilaginibacter sp.]|nr:hypothetical protein [Mucilaginibacter sp.]
MKATNETGLKKITTEDFKFALLTTFLVLLTHAIAFLLHEYSHSFLAWILGFKANPLALDYGKPTLKNIIFLKDVEENVDYKQIVASGNGVWGGVIALAGAGVGNGLLYFLCYWLTSLNRIRSSRGVVTFLYWLSLMGAANLLSYAPLRVITNHGDMFIAAHSFGVSTWLLFPFVTAGTVYVMYHFFFRMFPKVYRRVVANSGNNLVLMIVATSYWYFGFFGSDGTTFLPIILIYFFIPFSAMFLASRYLNIQVKPNDGHTNIS